MVARTLEHFPNLVTMFFTRAREKGDAPFLWAKDAAGWTSISWAQAAQQVASLATALKAAGLRKGDRVMLVSENRPEWCISDLAIMAAGCVTVPTYITNTERDHQHILENSGACAVIVSTAKLAKVLMPAVLRASTARIGVAAQSGFVCVAVGRLGRFGDFDFAAARRSRRGRAFSAAFDGRGFGGASGAVYVLHSRRLWR